jgi:hypothetical protein
MSVVMEGGAVSAAAVGFARIRPRRGRVRREPIDVELIAAEFAEPRKRPEHEIIAALEAEVQRVHQARATTAAAEPAPPVDALSSEAAPTVVAAVVAAPTPTLAPAAAPRARATSTQLTGDANGAGLPLDQVRAWLEQVKEDLRKVQARVEYLQFEQDRLQGQHHLVAELISATTPV